MKCIVVVTLLTLSACNISYENAPPASVTGTVTSKNMKAGHYETRLMPLPDGNGGFRYIPTTDYVPAQYKVVIDCGDFELVDTTQDTHDFVRQGDRVTVTYSAFLRVNEKKGTSTLVRRDVLSVRHD